MTRPTIGLSLLLLCGWSWADISPEREAYWWLDEIRTVAFELSQARTGRIAQWPSMVTPGGSGVLPVPKAAGTIACDGELNEAAWGQATTFPIGPVFGPWRDGQFSLQVSVCRDDSQAYVGIRSPVDLTDLASLAGDAALLTLDRPYRVGAGGGMPLEWVSEDGRVVELAVPLPEDGQSLTLTVASEVVRRPAGAMPAELASLGLTAHGGPVWLGPSAVQLVPVDADGVDLRAMLTNGEAHGSVTAATWSGQVGGSDCRLETFTYEEPVDETLRAAEELARRAGVDLHGLEAGATRGASGETPDPREKRREAYCRARELRARAQLALLDAPLLFVKRHAYFAGHIYDDYYTWHPGGGIYVRENPAETDAPPEVWTIVDPETPETLGGGVYRDPDVSWDASRIVFAHKPEQNAVTSIYEVGADGTGLKRLTESDKYHDITPAYLPDGRIVFSSTRPKALVPCFNSGVDTLHTMNADGTDVRSISSNNVTEFDPAVLPDGRIVYGRWEYVDKTALYMQSLWAMFPDGTGEVSLFANNLPKPTAVLDARPVPGTNLVVASLTPHNGQATGAIGMIDPALGKNNLAAITNFTPEYPAEMDQGLAVGPSDPWPLSADDVLITNNAVGKHGIIELIGRLGSRELVHCDPEISCFAPMLLKPRRAPGVLPSAGESETTGRFLVLDVYEGLTGVERGEVKRLRLVEETARISGLPPGGRWWNQAFLVSWQGAYVIKNFLGTVPVHEDGSAYFEAPAGRAVYLEALDKDGREVQRMRTFVQAVPGTTRTCIGCHERKHDAPPRPQRGQPLALKRGVSKPEAESWGSGYVDYPTMVQPVLDRRCVSCHGGETDISGGIDLSGGWTWAFNISYETLLKHDLVGFIRCNNADVSSSDILPPRTIGSGAARLGDLLLSGHKGRLTQVTPAERNLLMAWIDGNSNYYGTWDYTQQATCDAILSVRGPLASQMEAAGCVRCHASGHIGNDWVNLQHPERSRVLRAPLAEKEGGLGLAWCRERKARHGIPLVDQRIMPPDRFHPLELPRLDLTGDPAAPFLSTEDPHYLAMLRTIRRAAAQALASPRVDMPGAQPVRGVCRRQRLMPLPEQAPELRADLTTDGAVLLAWAPTTDVVGLPFELHRGTSADFTPTDETRVSENAPFRFTDYGAPPGEQHYALFAVQGEQRSRPSRETITVPEPTPPPAPTGLAATPGPGEVALSWDSPEGRGARYLVLRRKEGDAEAMPLTEAPLAEPALSDGTATVGVTYAYQVRAVDRRGTEGALSAAVTAAPLPEVLEPIFTLPLTESLEATLLDGSAVSGAAHGAARVAEGLLDLRKGGYVTFPHRPEFDVHHKLTVECEVYIDQAGDMPVIVACGAWPKVGWFLQRLGGVFRWHIGGVDCDGGTPAVGRWMRLVCTYDGVHSRLFQDGVEVQKVLCSPNKAPWGGALHVGQYSAPPGPQYQVTGRIRNVRIYQRALAVDEAR